MYRPNTNSRALLIALVLSGASATAHAQTAAPPPPPPPAAAPARPSDAELQDLVSRYKNLKLSGYVQGRYEWHDDAAFGLGAKNEALGTSRFFVRRGRLKVVYRGPMSEFEMQINSTGDRTNLRDAEAALVLTNEQVPLPQRFELKIGVGLIKVPFGHEVVQSSGDREMPERSRVVRAFFPEEVDQGIRLVGAYGVFRLAGGVFNGTFTGEPNAIYRAFDHSTAKDVIARAGADFKFLAFGASTQYGSTVRTFLGTAPTPTTYERYRRLRLGADAQLYFRTPRVGDASLKAELLHGKDTNRDFRGTPANPCKDVTTLGWYVTAVQNVGKYLGFVARLDQYDPDRTAGAACTDDVRTAVARDRVTSIAGGPLVYISPNLKLTLVYEHVGEQSGATRDNDVFFGQLQARF